MNLRVLFAVFVLLQIPVYAAVLYLTAGNNLWLFYGAEAFALVGICFSIYFYRKVLAPFRMLGNGLNLLKSGDWNLKLRNVNQPEVDSIVDVFNSMLQRLSLQQTRICEQTHFLSLLAEAAPVGIIVADSNGAVRMCNTCAARQLGMDAGIVKSLDSIDTPLGRAIVSLVDGKDCIVRSNAMEIRRVSRRHFMEYGVRKSFYIIADLADVVFKAERDAYEKLIRTIAHEVNNSISGIVTVLDSLEISGGDVELAVACKERAIGLSRFVGAYAGVVKTPLPVIAPVSVGDLLVRIRPFLESICTASGAELIIEMSGSTMVQADAVQLEQVIVNIVKNACESCGRGGRVRISADGKSLIVEDNGPGLSGEAVQNLFKPFYSSKPHGQGIGLTLVREILEHHSCRYSLATDCDGLTRFRILFS